MIARYSRPEMSKLWSEEAKYASWSRVERAHLEGLIERRGVPQSVLSAFDNAIFSTNSDDYLKREQDTGHDVIAYVAEVGAAMGDSGRWLHQGLTSSDVLDTALTLRVRESLDLLLKPLAQLRAALAKQAFAHNQTCMMGRTHGIHAEPLSFGQVLAGHFEEFQRAHFALLDAKRIFSTGKLSGAVGQYSQLNPDYENHVLHKLGLTAEPVATQVIPRDRLLRVGQACEALANAIDRFALNMRHWARTELQEVIEPFGSKQKGSSAMPHKKNPILAENLTGLARTVRGYVSMLGQNTSLWHERDISHSSVERMALPDLFVTVDFMTARAAYLIEQMVVQPDVMKRNLERLGGLWASQSVLTQLTNAGMNRTEAYELVQKIALPLSAQSARESIPADAFLKALEANPSVVDLLGRENLRNLFNLDRFVAHTPARFLSVFGATPDEIVRTHGGRVDATTVPALQSVYRVTVALNADVLDTEAKTIEQHMQTQGLSARLKRSKIFTINLPNESENKELLRYVSSVLCNEVMESIQVEVIQ
ncbi:adenylosuccinate lyase [bacterium]|nr:adenylosuccinate lyase [bacterium]